MIRQENKTITAIKDLLWNAEKIPAELIMYYSRVMFGNITNALINDVLTKLSESRFNGKLHRLHFTCNQIVMIGICSCSTACMHNEAICGLYRNIKFATKSGSRIYTSMQLM